MIHTGDCIEVMRTLPEASVDAVVTDPPYGLEFMGKAWDAFRSDDPGTNRHRGERAGASGASVQVPDAFREKKGSYPSLGGGERPKTNRCVGCGKRDQFRNPHSCPEGTPWKSELIDPYAAPPSSLAFQNWCRTWALEALRVTKPGGYLLAFGGTRTHHRLVCGLEDAGWIIRDELTWVYASGFPKGKANLKPAHEPIVLARKPGPLRPLAIDACRIGYEDTPNPATNPGYRAANGYKQTHAARESLFFGARPDREMPAHPSGRWPSNLLLSDPALFDEPNPYVVGSGAVDAGGGFGVRGASTHIYGGGDGFTEATGETVGYGDTGGYSRFFIIPKAARADREPVLKGQLTKRAMHPLEEQAISTASNRRCTVCGLVKFGQPHCECENPVWAETVQRENSHPTVKPVDLMRHLVRLVTPPGGTVLDCFLGSGSTALACELEGFPWIGIEKEAEYVAIAEARLNGIQKGLGLAI